VRKFILLLLTGAMLAGGIYLVTFELLFAQVIFFRLMVGGGLLALAGGYLLWTDFVAPRLGIRTWED
jgi:hypothetical protein